MSSSRVHVVIFPFVLRHMDFSFLSYEHMIFFLVYNHMILLFVSFSIKYVAMKNNRDQHTHPLVTNVERKRNILCFLMEKETLKAFFSCSVLSHAVVEDSKTGIIYITKYIISGTRPRQCPI